MFKFLKIVVVFVMGFGIGALSKATFSLYPTIKGTYDIVKKMYNLAEEGKKKVEE